MTHHGWLLLDACGMLLLPLDCCCCCCACCHCCCRTCSIGGAPPTATRLTGAACSCGSSCSRLTAGCTCSPCVRRLCFVAATASRSSLDAWTSPLLPLSCARCVASASVRWRFAWPLPALCVSALNLSLLAPVCERSVTRGSRQWAPSSVAFSTSQSVRPPLSVRHAAATTHCGPHQGCCCGSAVAISCRAENAHGREG